MLGIALSVIIGALLGFFHKSPLVLAHADNLIMSSFILCWNRYRKKPKCF